MNALRHDDNDVSVFVCTVDAGVHLSAFTELRRFHNTQSKYTNRIHYSSIAIEIKHHIDVYIKRLFKFKCLLLHSQALQYKHTQTRMSIKHRWWDGDGCVCERVCLSIWVFMFLCVFGEMYESEWVNVNKIIPSLLIQMFHHSTYKHQPTSINFQCINFSLIWTHTIHPVCHFAKSLYMRCCQQNVAIVIAWNHLMILTPCYVIFKAFHIVQMFVRTFTNFSGS